MHIAGYNELGSIGKPEGVSGKTRLRFKRPVPEDYGLPEFIFIVHEGLPVPYRILEGEIRHQDLAVVLLNTIDTPEKARAIGGLKVLVRADEERRGLLPAGDELIGFRVEDREDGTLGDVVRLDQLPGHELLVVAAESGELLIPLVETMIVDVNTESRIITVDLPDGLLDINQ